MPPALVTLRKQGTGAGWRPSPQASQRVWEQQPPVLERPLHTGQGQHRPWRIFCILKRYEGHDFKASQGESLKKSYKLGNDDQPRALPARKVSTFWNWPPRSKLPAVHQPQSICQTVCLCPPNIIPTFSLQGPRELQSRVFHSSLHFTT